jgi:nodulation protein E
MTADGRRVAITGLGAVTALGIGVRAFWDALVAGRGGVGRITHFDPSTYVAQAAAEVPAFDPDQWLDASEREWLDRFAQFALVAAREAVAHAGLELAEAERDRAGVAIGSGMGGIGTQDDRYKKLYGEGTTRLHPFSIPRMMNSAASAQLSMRLGLRGPALAMASACAASGHAIGEAAEMIRAGRADVMLAGGADAPIVPGVVRCWEAMRVLAPVPADGDASRACRPFSRDRAGMVLGEGAGVVVLEAWDRAAARGAPILAELAGYGATADACHITQLAVDAAARATTLALAQARLAPEDVDYVNAHGTATRLNDATETAIIKRAFGAHARALAISATKAAHGHTMGATGAIELIASVLAVHHGVVPPTINFTAPDPDCDLDYTPNCARPMRVRAAVSNSFAFGGLNAVLAIRRT